MDAVGRHLLYCKDIGVVVEVLGGVDHLGEAAALMLHQHVGQEQRERLVADQFARAPDRMAEAERRLLAGEAEGARLRQILRQKRQVRLLAALNQGQFEFELAVEMVLDHRLMAAGDEDKMLDTGLPRLVHHVLDQRAVHHGQHFLRHGLGSRQEAGAETGDREYGFTDTGHARLAV